MAGVSRRTLHWVFKIGERRETMRFYREVFTTDWSLFALPSICLLQKFGLLLDNFWAGWPLSLQHLEICFLILLRTQQYE